ncbi:MAG: tRNA (adenosine(37)-N6)-threonylcarbamoyltransferase complex transferase subunit TsaD [Candidatus Omnitrophota bacterium]
MLTLGIETSCDETAVALVEDKKVLSSEVSSSVHLHSQYGGVVPEIASRAHVEYIYPVLKKALKESDRSLNEVDLVAVTRGPGLPGSLLVGIAFAKAISSSGNVPLVGINHLPAHIFSCFLDESGKSTIADKFPFVGMVISGGHTSIYLCRALKDFELIGRTKDDAVGEAFDKVAKVLDLGYPGGPIVEKRAENFSGEKGIDFPRALGKDESDLDFSFSGLKTAVLYYWQGCSGTESEKDRISWSFQNAILDVVEEKILRAIKLTGVKRLAVGGGVINNEALRKRVADRCREEGITLFLPRKEYTTDNAAMIAALGEALYNDGVMSDLFLNAEPSAP